MKDVTIARLWQALFHFASAFLLQNEASIITKRGRYNKTKRSLLQNGAYITKRGKRYYETGQVLQNEANVITKRGRYYKIAAINTKRGNTLSP